MRLPRVRLSLALLAVLAACSSNRAPATGETPDAGGPGTAGDSGGPGGTPVGAGEYAPDGCDYVVALPATRGFTDFARDGASPFAADQAKPVRVRLGLGGRTTSGAKGYADPATSVAVTWETAGPIGASKVRIGASRDALTGVHTGYSYSVPAPTVGVGAGDGPLYVHEVHVCGLQPGKTYAYQAGGGPAGQEVWSEPLTFATPPASGDILIGVSGDARDDADVWRLVQTRFRDLGVTLQLFSGDLVLFGVQGSAYMKWLDKIVVDASGLPLTLGRQLMIMVGGNHENASSQYYGSFALPGAREDAYPETYGSFDAGNTHFAFLDDQRIADGVDPAQSAAQLAWLDKDLERANGRRDQVPFLVVVLHRSPFSTSLHGAEDEVHKVRDAMVPIFDRHHVDLALGGHDHNYERSKPITGPGAAPVVQTSPTAGTTYVVCAGAGASEYPKGVGPEAYRETNTQYGSGTAFVGVYATLKQKARTLEVKAYGLKTGGGDDVIDSFTLAR